MVIAQSWAQPCAYFTDGKHLYEIFDNDNGIITYENCVTNVRLRVREAYVVQRFRCVKRAPQVPRFADDC